MPLRFASSSRANRCAQWLCTPPGPSKPEQVQRGAVVPSRGRRRQPARGSRRMCRPQSPYPGGSAPGRPRSPRPCSGGPLPSCPSARTASRPRARRRSARCAGSSAHSLSMLGVSASAIALFSGWGSVPSRPGSPAPQVVRLIFGSYDRHLMHDNAASARQSLQLFSVFILGRYNACRRRTASLRPAVDTRLCGSCTGSYTGSG